MPPATAAAPPAAPGAADEQPQQPNPVFGLLRMLAIWWLIKSFFGGRGGNNAPKTTSQLSRSDFLLPLMQRGTPVDLAMVLSEESFLAPGWSEFSDKNTRKTDAAQVVFRKSALPLATMPGEEKLTVAYTPSEVRNFDFFCSRSRRGDACTHGERKRKVKERLQSYLRGDALV